MKRIVLVLTLAVASLLASAQTKVYKVGDYYNDGEREGVVFQVSDGGLHGKIVSLKQPSGELDWSNDEAEQARFIGATDSLNGANNMKVVMAIDDWKQKYPAFAWCADLGSGWYLPSIEELRLLTLDDIVHDAVNATLAAHKGIRLYNKRDMGWYWSSTEVESIKDGVYCAQMVRMVLCGVFSESKKNINYVCAVAAF